MSKYWYQLIIVLVTLFSASTLADAASFGTANLTSFANTFANAHTKVTLYTATECSGYNALENFATVSPVAPLRLFISSSVRDRLVFSLTDPTLGIITRPGANILELTYLTQGTTNLQGFVGAEQILNVPIKFIPERKVKVNFFHINDAQGHASWKMKQETMSGYIQEAQTILNQAGITIEIGQQNTIFLKENLGESVDADAASISFDESIILKQIGENTDAISVVTVWDYQISNQSKVGMNYYAPNVGSVVFISDATSKPGETLAHEILHSLGLDHNTLGDSYLMAEQEKTGTSQCLLSRSEIQRLAVSA